MSVEPLAPRSLGDTWIDDLILPERVPAGAAFTATVAVGSQRDRQAVVELRSGGKIVGTQSVAVAKGSTQVAINAVARRARPVRAAGGAQDSPAIR